ncbi:MAG: arabinose efflux permease family protein [Burkholderiaceae bacterium]|nr:arabinose efflux permease family protein [Burkholderiaceae bacterium]
MLGTHIALFATGFGAFLSLYCTQPLLPLLRQIYGVSELQASLTVSAPVLAVALMAPLAGMMADALGRKLVIVAALFGLALPTVLVATSDSLNQIILWRFFQGIFVPAVISATIAYISEESATGTVGATMATYVTGTVVGGFVGRFSVGWIAQHSGWREAFVLLGALSLVIALMAWWLLPAATRFVRQKNAANALRSMGRHFRNPQLLATFAVGFNVLFSLVGAFTYVNFYLADEPFMLGTAALASIFAVYLVGAVVTPLAGRLLDRIGFRRMLMLAVAMSACGLLLTFMQSLSAVIVGLAIHSSGVFACQSASSGHVGKAAHEARSSAAGLYVTFYYLGGFVGSSLPGYLWNSTGWTGCVGLMLCLQAITIIIAHKLWADK